MLFGVFVVLVVAVIALAAYSLGALLHRPKKHLYVQQVVQLPVIANPPPPPQRMARGTTPQPFNSANDQSTPRGVISNREDATEPDASPDARFSIRRSSKRIL